MPTPASVSASSVRSGRISLTAPTSVVLPTPKPPAIRILRATGTRRPGRSEGAESIEHRLEDVLVGQSGSVGRRSNVDQAGLARRSPSRTRTTPSGRSRSAASSATEVGWRDSRRIAQVLRAAGRRIGLRGVPRRDDDATGRAPARPAGSGRRSARRAGPPGRPRRRASVSPVYGHRPLIPRYGVAASARVAGAAATRQVLPDPLDQHRHLVGDQARCRRRPRLSTARQAPCPAAVTNRKAVLHLDDGLPDRAAAEVPAGARGRGSGSRPRRADRCSASSRVSPSRPRCAARRRRG